MSPSLDIQLCEKYPKIFKNRYKKPIDSPISFGIECGDGWYKVIDMLCLAASNVYSTSIYVDAEDGIKLGLKPNEYNKEYYFGIQPPQVIADQIKEKFGSLRFYYHLEFDPKIIELNVSGKYPEIEKIISRYNDYFDGIVYMAEILSINTCEDTGREGEIHVSGGNRGGWYKTLNAEYAKSEPFYVDRNYIPVSMVAKD